MGTSGVTGRANGKPEQGDRTTHAGPALKYIAFYERT